MAFLYKAMVCGGLAMGASSPCAFMKHLPNSRWVPYYWFPFLRMNPNVLLPWADGAQSGHPEMRRDRLAPGVKKDRKLTQFMYPAYLHSSATLTPFFRPVMIVVENYGKVWNMLIWSILWSTGIAWLNFKLGLLSLQRGFCRKAEARMKHNWK